MKQIRGYAWMAIKTQRPVWRINQNQNTGHTLVEAERILKTINKYLPQSILFAQRK